MPIHRLGGGIRDISHSEQTRQCKIYRIDVLNIFLILGEQILPRRQIGKDGTYFSVFPILDKQEEGECAAYKSKKAL